MPIVPYRLNVAMESFKESPRDRWLVGFGLRLLRVNLLVKRSERKLLNMSSLELFLFIVPFRMSLT